MLPRPLSRLLLMLFGALALTACQTTPNLRGFTPQQVAMLQSNGFVETEEGWQLSLNDRLLFAVDSADLLPETRASITRMAAGLRSVGIERARIEGHTDATGSDDYNQRLSQARAAAVAADMQAQGFDSAALAVRGWGETMPIADNATEEGRAQNRRVVIIVTAL